MHLEDIFFLEAFPISTWAMKIKAQNLPLTIAITVFILCKHNIAGNDTDQGWYVLSNECFSSMGGSATILYYYSTPETDSRMTKLQVNRKSSGSGGELPLSRSETSLCTNDVYTIIIRKTKIARKKVPWWRDHLSRDKIRYWWKTNFFPLIEVNIFSANSPTSFELSKWSLAGVELDVFLYGARRHAVCDVWLYWLSLPKKNDQILFSRLELFYTAYEVDSACWIRNSFCTL